MVGRVCTVDGKYWSLKLENYLAKLVLFIDVSASANVSVLVILRLAPAVCHSRLITLKKQLSLTFVSFVPIHLRLLTIQGS